MLPMDNINKNNANTVAIFRHPCEAKGFNKTVTRGHLDGNHPHYEQRLEIFSMKPPIILIPQPLTTEHR